MEAGHEPHSTDFHFPGDVAVPAAGLLAADTKLSLQYGNTPSKN